MYVERLKECFVVCILSHSFSPLSFPARPTYGAPISRRRIYALLIQESAMTDEALGVDFFDYVQKKLKSMHIRKTTVAWMLALSPS